MQKSLHQSFINHLLFVNHDHSSNSRINWGLFILLLNNDHFSRSTKNSSMLQWLRFIHHSIIHNKYVLHPPIVNNDDRKVWWSRRLCGGYALFSALHQSFTTWIIPRIVLRFCGWASEIQKKPADRWSIPWFTGFQSSKVVQDFATIHSSKPIYLVTKSLHYT